jgi:hypothetical protein
LTLVTNEGLKGADRPLRWPTSVHRKVIHDDPSGGAAIRWIGRDSRYGTDR